MAYITTKVVSMHKEGIDINEPARRSMQEKTLLPFDYHFDAQRIIDMYSQDMRKGWAAFLTWRATVRRQWREKVGLPTDENDKAKD